MKFRHLKPTIRWWSIANPRLLAHFTESLEVQTDRFVHKKGVFTKRENVILFARITNYSIYQSFFDRIFGVANLYIETEAHSFASGLELKSYPFKLQEFITTMMLAYEVGD
ncbi:MAG: PH domain-containing protein [Anaerolineae bacterium]|nr:PH domain-containing protein [Anaerolineae bacterium]MDK1080110.1 PH domain-containing protein [Anaerolineae bacterium]MDK1118568.1 PH domain-containing protein [Anaerolineae bacterium]